MRKSARSSATPKERKITRGLLRGWQIPTPDPESDKDDRGVVLVVGGARELPGAAILAGTAALRAGAGKLRIATCASVSAVIGAAIPESRCVGLDETESGSLSSANAAKIAEFAQTAHCVIVGPGLLDQEEVAPILEHLARTEATLVLDAVAIAALRGRTQILRGRRGLSVLTPHAGELAALTATPREHVQSDASGTTLRAAAALDSVVALKGPSTHIASPAGKLFVYSEGRVGLATSGSGDVLAGVIAGLLARGCDPLQATAWGVFLHGAAGNRLRNAHGEVGLLARELPDEIPALLRDLNTSSARATRARRSSGKSLR